jgi:hypothetical protein
MKKIVKVRFGLPKHIQSLIDGIEILYNYDVIHSSENNLIIREDKIIKKSIRVILSGSLANSWGFKIWQSSEEYSDLIKILFVYALQEIKELYNNGQLPEHLTKRITPQIFPTKRPNNAAEIPEIQNYEDELEVIEL